LSREARRNDELSSTLGHRFGNPALLEEALTHPSVERPRGQTKGDYERLEFLGDRVLGLVIADRLLRLYPDSDAGALARRYNTLVRRETLAEVAETIGLGEHIRLSKSEHGAGGREKPAILADVCEAVIGAVYVDGGLEPAADFIRRHWDPMAEKLARAPKDAKTALQEWAHARGLEGPVYDVVGQAGPDHDTFFTVEVRLKDREAAKGEGRSKRVAEQAAAELMLERLQRGGND
jgi:ribonuclease-3